MKIDPNTHEKFFNILKSVVIPRPIAFISSQSQEGVVNLAPFSFFNGVCYNPPLISVAISRFAGEKAKDTLPNIETTGQFVVNLVNKEIAEAMNKTAAEYPSAVDEFDVAGLTKASCEKVKAPRVLESPVSLECELTKVVLLNENQPNEIGLVIAEVVYCHVDDEMYDGRYIDMEALNVIGRLGGHSYCDVKDPFEMILPVYQPTKD